MGNASIMKKVLEKGGYTVEPLQRKGYYEVLKTAHRIFPYDDPKDINFCYTLSLTPRKKWPRLHGYEKYKDLADSLERVNYYVFRSPDGKIAGVTGIYVNKDDPDSAWLGWFGVDPNFRNKGLGRQILYWTMAKAQSMGKSSFRLWTSDLFDTDAARALYRKEGFSEEIGDDVKKGIFNEYHEVYCSHDKLKDWVIPKTFAEKALNYKTSQVNVRSSGFSNRAKLGGPSLG